MKRQVLRILLLFVGYELLYLALPVKQFLPSLPELGKSFLDAITHKEIYLHIFSSLGRVFVGFCLASILAICTGVLIGSTETLKWLRTYIELMRPIPPIAWIPISILIFGTGNATSYFIVGVGTFFPVFANTYFGVTSLPVIYKNVSRSFEFSYSTYITRIVFAWALPNILTGLKIGIGMAWMSVIAAELVAARSGLGYYIQLNRLLLRTDNVLLGMGIIGIIGYLLTWVIEKLEPFLLPWRRHI